VQSKQENMLIQKGLYLNDDGLVLCPSCGVYRGTFYLTTHAHCTLIPLPMVTGSTAVAAVPFSFELGSTYLGSVCSRWYEVLIVFREGAGMFSFGLQTHHSLNVSVLLVFIRYISRFWSV